MPRRIKARTAFGLTQQDRQDPEIPPEGTERDERGLSPWHYYPPGKQLICGVCNCHPCADDCPEPFEPDRLEWKAARANMTIAQWAADPLHAAWIAAHADRPDVAAWLEGQPPDAATAGPSLPAASAAPPIPSAHQGRPVPASAAIFAAPSSAALAQQEQAATAVQRCREAGDAFMRELGIDSEEGPFPPVREDALTSACGGEEITLEPALQEVAP